MPPPSKAAAGLLPALAALLLLAAQPAAAAAQRGERRLLAKAITLPSDAAKSAVVNPAPPPPPGGPALQVPAPAEKCETAAPPSQRTASEQPAAQGSSAPPDITGLGSSWAQPAPSRTEKCLTKDRPPTWEEWAVWLEANDAKVDALFKGAGMRRA